MKKNKIGKKTLLCRFGIHSWMPCPEGIDLPADLPLDGNLEICPQCFKIRGSWSANDYKIAIVSIKEKV